jgi:hypothetical protein
MRVSKFLAAGTVMKNYRKRSVPTSSLTADVVLVMLTRLRQAANHPVSHADRADANRQWLLRRKPGDEGSEGDLLVDDEAFGADLGQCRDNDEAEFGRAVAILGKPVVDGLVKRLEERHERMTDDVDDDDQELDCSICYEVGVTVWMAANV